MCACSMIAGLPSHSFRHLVPTAAPMLQFRMFLFFVFNLHVHSCSLAIDNMFP